MTTVVFSHGQESGPWGTKIRAMADLVESKGLTAVSIDYQGIADPTERVHKLVAEASDSDDRLRRWCEHHQCREQLHDRS